MPPYIAQLEEFASKLEAIELEHGAELEQEQERSREECEKLMDVSKQLGAELERYKDELERYREEIEDLKDDNEAKVQI